MFLKACGVRELKVSDLLINCYHRLLKNFLLYINFMILFYKTECLKNGIKNSLHATGLGSRTFRTFEYMNTVPDLPLGFFPPL